MVTIEQLGDRDSNDPNNESTELSTAINSSSSNNINETKKADNEPQVALPDKLVSTIEELDDDTLMALQLAIDEILETRQGSEQQNKTDNS
jgi:hypothetical protein